MAKQINSMFRADSDLMEWWAKSAAKAGMSRNDAFNVVLGGVRKAIEKFNSEGTSGDLAEFGLLIGESIAMRGLGGKLLRQVVIKSYKANRDMIEEIVDQPGKREALRVLDEWYETFKQGDKNYGK